METCMDFLNLLEPDMSIKILRCLDDPSDLVRVSSVSRSLHCCVIANGLCKELCLRMFPQLSSVVGIAELGCSVKTLEDVGSSSAMEWESLEREHTVYTFLARALTSFALGSCISEAISASSTDNYPEESIDNTLEPSDRVGERGSYWSSEGKSDPAAVETLVYKLVASMCLVTEINIQPFQAYFQPGFPIYSAKSVRFRMGHCYSSVDEGSDLSGVANQHCADERFIWTYTSPEFPMAQENCLQTFKLPEPALCIGGMLQVELLGRVQRQDMDDLFYTCIAHVQVVGRRLSPAFSAKIVDPCGNFLLQYYPPALNNHSPSSNDDENQAVSVENILPPKIVGRHIRGWEQILNMVRGDVIDADYAWIEEEESDEE